MPSPDAEGLLADAIPQIRRPNTDDAAGLIADAGPSRQEWKDERIPVEQRAKDFLDTHVRIGTPWEKVAPQVRQFGLDPEKARPQFEMSAARQRAATMAEPGLYRILGDLPGAATVRDIALSREYSKASKRIAEGKAAEHEPNWLGRQFGSGKVTDYDFVAQYERLHQISQDRPLLAAAGRTLEEVPKMAVEFAAGGRVAKLALAKAGLLTAAGEAIPATTNLGALTRPVVSMAANTAPIPAMYVPRMIENNRAADRDPLDLRGLPAAFALGTLNTAVLGRLQGRASTLNVPGGLAGRAAVAGGVGVVEQQAVDAVASGTDLAARRALGVSLDVDTQFGVLGKIAGGRPGALRDAVLQAVTFASFAALHGRKPESVLEKVKQAVDGAANPAEAAQRVQAVVDQLRQPVVEQPATKPGPTDLRPNDLFDEAMRQGPPPARPESTKPVGLRDNPLLEDVFGPEPVRPPRSALPPDTQTETLGSASQPILGRGLPRPAPEGGGFLRNRPRPEAPESPPAASTEKPGFRPGGQLEAIGGLAGHFGENSVHIIPSTDDPRIAFVTGLRGKDVASVVPQIIHALQEQGFRDIQYRPDNQDGRAAARVRLFESLKRRFKGLLEASEPPPAAPEARPAPEPAPVAQRPAAAEPAPVPTERPHLGLEEADFDRGRERFKAELGGLFDEAGLTARERHVLTEVAAGRSLDEIARDEPMAKRSGEVGTKANASAVGIAAARKLRDKFGAEVPGVKVLHDEMLAHARAEQVARGERVDLSGDPETNELAIVRSKRHELSVQDHIDYVDKKGTKLLDSWEAARKAGTITPELEKRYADEYYRLAKIVEGRDTAAARRERAADRKARQGAGTPEEAQPPGAAHPAAPERAGAVAAPARAAPARVTKPAKQDTSEFTVNTVKGLGGIDPADSSFRKHFSSVSEAKEHGGGWRHVGLFKSGGKGLDEIAQQMHAHGELPDADTHTLIDFITHNRPTRAADTTVHYEQQAREYDRRHQEAADALAAEHPAPTEEPPNVQQGPQTGSTEFDPTAYHAGFPIPMRLFNAMSRLVFGRTRGKNPNFQPDADPNLDNPRAMPDYGIAKRAAFNQLGARNHTRAEIATTAHAYEKHVGEQVANEWHLAHQKLDAAFPVDRVTGDVPLATGRGFLGDVIEKEMVNPGSQPLTAEQRAAVGMWKDILKKQLTAMKQAGVKKFYDDQGAQKDVATLLAEGYFPHTTLKPSEVASAFAAILGRGVGGSAKPGIKPGYRHARVYDTEEAGHAADVRYVGSFSERVTDFIKNSNREIADTHLANDPMLQGEDVIHKAIGAAMVANKPALDALTAAGKTQERADLERQIVMLASQAATGNVFVAPAFRGKLFPPEVKAHLEAQFGERAGPYLKLAGALSQELRNLVLGADVSWVTLQLGKMMFSNPVRWAKAVKGGLTEIINPGVLQRTLQRPEYGQAAREIVQAGGSLGKLPEQTATLGGGRSLVEQIPLVGPALARLNAGFATAMDMAKLELWRAVRPADPKQWSRTVEAIENSLGQGRMGQLGMSPERAFLERMFFLAPGYYRAHIKLLEQAFQGGVPGQVARKQLGALAGGVFLTSLAGLHAAKSQGWITDEELEERLDPKRGKFLMVPIKLGDSGKSAEVGLGGFYISMLRSLASAEKMGVKDAAFHWYRGHAGSLPRAAADIGTGHDFFGKPVSAAEALLRSVAPVAVQNVAFDEGTREQNVAGATAGLVGLRSFAASEQGQYLDRLRKFTKESTGKPWNDLSLYEQIGVTKHYQRIEPKPPIPPDQLTAARERAIVAEEQAQKRITAAVTPETRKALTDLGKTLPPPENGLHVAGVVVPMNEERQKRFEAILAEEYDRTVAHWPLARLVGVRADQRAEFLTRQLEEAKGRAKARLVRESK